MYGNVYVYVYYGEKESNFPMRPHVQRKKFLCVFTEGEMGQENGVFWLIAAYIWEI